MEFDHNNVRRVAEEDRLSSLPDELIHKILSSFDMKFVVQTWSLSSRWKLVWKSMPCLNFLSGQFGILPKFSKFVTNVLSRRNHQVEVSSIKLSFTGAASQVFVRKIANYAFSHNVQQLSVVCCPKNNRKFPPSLFSSHSLKHFTFSSFRSSPCVTPKTPWDFPALTTLHLSDITLCDDSTQKSVDLFSKCVNLKNLTLEDFIVLDVEVFDIITPRLSNLILIDGHCSKAINLIAPQLENLTIIRCSINYLNAPPELSSLYYRGYLPMQFFKERLHSLNKVTICLYLLPYNEEDAHKTIKLLQELHSATYLTLNVDIVECLSSYPDLVSHHPSPFSNLISLTVDSSMRDDAYKVKMSTEARNFFLDNSPNATFIMELPEAPPTKAMKQKEARAKKKAQQASELETHMKELQTFIHQGNMIVEPKEKVKADFNNLMAQLRLCRQKPMQIGQSKEEMEMQLQIWKADTRRLLEQFKICFEEIQVLMNEENTAEFGIFSKKGQIRILLETLGKREREKVEARISAQLEEAEAQHARLASEFVNNSEYLFAFTKLLSDHDILTMLSSSSTTIPTPSASSINPIP